MGYATGADMKLFFDERTLKDLASDNGVPAATLATDERIIASLDAASGKIEAALVFAKTYSPAELAALTGNALNYLKYICCYLAMAMLIARRPEKIKEEFAQKILEEGEGNLEKLRRGERMFYVETHSAVSVPTIDGISIVREERLNLMPQKTRNFYPSATNRHPLGR